MIDVWSVQYVVTVGSMFFFDKETMRDREPQTRSVCWKDRWSHSMIINDRFLVLHEMVRDAYESYLSKRASYQFVLAKKRVQFVQV